MMPFVLALGVGVVLLAYSRLGLGNWWAIHKKKDYQYLKVSVHKSRLYQVGPWHLLYNVQGGDTRESIAQARSVARRCQWSFWTGAALILLSFTGFSVITYREISQPIDSSASVSPYDIENVRFQGDICKQNVEDPAFWGDTAWIFIGVESEGRDAWRSQPIIWGGRILWPVRQPGSEVTGWVLTDSGYRDLSFSLIGSSKWSFRGSNYQVEKDTGNVVVLTKHGCLTEK